MRGPAFRRSSLGMALLLVSAALAPLEFRQGRSGLSVCLLLAAFLCGFWILRMVVVQQRVVFDDRESSWPHWRSWRSQHCRS